MAQRLLLQRSLSLSARYSRISNRFTPTAIVQQITRTNISSTSSYSLQNQHRYIHVSHPVLSDKEEQEKDDNIPFFQNPLHHDDPNNEKVMLSDYENGQDPELVPLPPLDDGSGKVVAAPHLHDLADEVVNLTMLEMKELVERVADHFGIEETADDDLGVAAAAVVEEEVVEEKTAFDLKMTAFDDKSKIKVIKEIRAITGLGLKEAKEMVEGVPKVIKKDIKMEEAEELKAKLEAVGATIEIV